MDCIEVTDAITVVQCYAQFSVLLFVPLFTSKHYQCPPPPHYIYDAAGYDGGFMGSRNTAG